MPRRGTRSWAVPAAPVGSDVGRRTRPCPARARPAPSAWRATRGITIALRRSARGRAYESNHFCFGCKVHVHDTPYPSVRIILLNPALSASVGMPDLVKSFAVTLFARIHLMVSDSLRGPDAVTSTSIRASTRRCSRVFARRAFAPRPWRLPRGLGQPPQRPSGLPHPLPAAAIAPVLVLRLGPRTMRTEPRLHVRPFLLRHHGAVWLFELLPPASAALAHASGLGAQRLESRA